MRPYAEVEKVEFEVVGAINSETKHVIIPKALAAIDAERESCTTGFTLKAQAIAVSHLKVNEGLQYSISIGGVPASAGEVPINRIIDFVIPLGFAQVRYRPDCPDVPTAPNGGFKVREGSITFSRNGKAVQEFQFIWRPTDGIHPSRID